LGWPALPCTTRAKEAGSSLAVLPSRIIRRSPKRTINSFEAQIAEDRFIERRRRGSNIAFFSTRIAGAGIDALSDQRSYPMGTCVPVSSWSNK
jgi:hypothetical protein